MLLTEKYPVPAEPTTQRHAGAGNTVKIRFVEREGNESDMLNPLQEYPGRVRVQRVERGDPTSSVAKQFRSFWTWVRGLAIDIRSSYPQKSATVWPLEQRTIIHSS
jgi:hypothetical protein